MHVVHVVRQFHPGIGGLENFVRDLAGYQVRGGKRVSVVTIDRVFDDPDQRNLSSEWWQGIEIRRLPARGSDRYPLWPGMLEAIADADIVHVHGVDFAADFLAATKRIHRKPIVLSTHGGFFHTAFARRAKAIYFNTITRLALSRYAAVIACSEEDYRRFSGIGGRRVTLIANPVDTDKFRDLADTASDTLIYFGRLALNKEIPRLLRWFAGLAGRREQSRLIIAGRPMGSPPAELADLAESLGIADKVSWFLSPSDEELRELIARSGTYICASSYEGFGLAAVEGASAGLFPVLSDIPPFASTLDKLHSGMLVDFADPSTWGESYVRFEREVAAFRATANRARLALVLQQFAWPSAVSAFDEVYRKARGDDTRKIGPVDVDVLDRSDAIVKIEADIGRRTPSMTTFCNAHTVNLARRNPRFRRALSKFRVLNDGVGVDLASRTLFGRAFPDNLNGTDFIPDLLRNSRQRLSIYFLGSRPGIARQAAATVAERYPNVSIAGTHDGYFADDEEPAIAEHIRRSGANLVLVAMGQSRQELWTERNAERLACPVICVGALFDFLSGAIPRAPDAFRRLRLEWVYRLALEPRRLASRYLWGNATFLSSILRQKLVGSPL